MEFLIGKENEKLPEDSTDEEISFQKLRNAIIKWWKKLCAEGYKWNNRRELVEYCKNDVRLLALGTVSE